MAELSFRAWADSLADTKSPVAKSILLFAETHI